MRKNILLGLIGALILCFAAVAFATTTNTNKSAKETSTSKNSTKSSSKQAATSSSSSSDDGNDNVIYLTFDDGPSDTTTAQLLDILKANDVKATFFVTGYGYDDLIKREHDEGHQIGLHTMTHNYSLVYSSVDAYFDDLKQISDRVKRITGQKSMMVRVPGGSSNTVSANY